MNGASCAVAEEGGAAEKRAALPSQDPAIAAAGAAAPTLPRHRLAVMGGPWAQDGSAQEPVPACCTPAGAQHVQSAVPGIATADPGPGASTATGHAGVQVPLDVSGTVPLEVDLTATLPYMQARKAMRQHQVGCGLVNGESSPADRWWERGASLTADA
jgi:hypothetical protein